MREFLLCLLIVAIAAVVVKACADSGWALTSEQSHTPRKSTEREQYQPIVPSKGFKYEA